MPFLIDVNLWTALIIENHVHHEAATSWFDKAPFRSTAFCRVTQMGVLRMLTNAKVMGSGLLTMVSAWETYATLRDDGRVFFSAEPENLEQRWKLLAGFQPVSGSRWTDLYLAGFALAASMTLVTFDPRFAHIPVLEVIVLPAPATPRNARL